MNLRVSLFSALAALALTGCGVAEEPVSSTSGALRTLPFHPVRPSACAAPAHRQFDFWLGQWNVFDPSGAQVGTNIVKGGLDGCAVEESWTDAGGGRGRSLNAYDSQTGSWHQTWVADALGHLRMAGGLDQGGRMVLTGTRTAAATGLLFQDRYVWTRLSASQVRQEGTLDIPARDLHFSFDGLYVRSRSVTPVPAPGTTLCQRGGSAAASRDFDFALGRWSVQTESGLPLASSDLTGDLSGCLFQEDLRAPLGYQARSFLYYDPLERRWFQTLVDNQGGRVELAGALAGGRLELVALAQPLRVIWQALDATTLQQAWEISLDGGATWTATLKLRYRRR